MSIANTIKTRKRLNEVLGKDTQIWADLQPKFSLGLATRDNEKVSEKFLKAYYYDCYEPARKAYYNDLEDLNEFQKNAVASRARNLFFDKYGDYFVDYMPLYLKSLILSGTAIGLSGASFACNLLLDSPISLGFAGAAVATASTAVYYSTKGVKQSSTDTIQSTQILKTLLKGGEYPYLAMLCDEVYIKKNIRAKERNINSEQIRDFS